MLNHILSTIIISIIILIVIPFIFWKLIFLRDPRRHIPQGDVIVSPADGKVISIKKISSKDTTLIKKGLIGKIKTMTADVSESCYVVSIFMNLINVHVNRSPMDGKIISVKHTKGTFLIVNTIEAGLSNEKSEILIKTKIGNIKVIQIAGFLARRIETWTKPDNKVKKGFRIGRINLGSQVVLIMPDNVKLQIKKNEKVKAGTTIIATYQK